MIDEEPRTAVERLKRQRARPRLIRDVRRSSRAKNDLAFQRLAHGPDWIGSRLARSAKIAAEADCFRDSIIVGDVAQRVRGHRKKPERSYAAPSLKLVHENLLQRERGRRPKRLRRLARHDDRCEQLAGERSVGISGEKRTGARRCGDIHEGSSQRGGDDRREQAVPRAEGDRRDRIELLAACALKRQERVVRQPPGKLSRRIERPQGERRGPRDPRLGLQILGLDEARRFPLLRERGENLETDPAWAAAARAEQGCTLDQVCEIAPIERPA